MEFFLTLAIISGSVASLSIAMVFPIFRLKRRYTKQSAVVIGLGLFVLFAWAGFVFLIAESARRGHPF